MLSSDTIIILNKTLSNFQIYYDDKYKLVRYDLVNTQPTPPLFTVDPITEIHDYNAGKLANKVVLNWAASWQNQQSDCAPSEDSDQPGHPPSLIRVFAVRSMGS